jgi:hypothetical protein
VVKKCESILVNVLAPFIMKQILEELKSVKYLLITLMVDASKHKNLKLVPVIVRYFTREERVQTQVNEFHNLLRQNS